MQAFYRLIRKTKTFLFKISMEDKLLFLEAFFLTGIMRFKILKKPFNKLKEEMGINATLINPRYITGLDKEMLEELTENHQVVITLEDGILNGGFGEKIASFYGNKDMKVLNFGAHKEFTNRVPLAELYERYHLTEELIVNDIKAVLK